MKRVFGLIVIIVVASAGAASHARAQSRRVWRVEPPKDERAGKSETKDETKDEAGHESKGASKDAARDEARADEDRPLTGREVSVRAVVKSKPNPGYPSEARGYGVEGKVKLRIILGAGGKVDGPVEVLEGLPYGLTEEAIKAARRIRFEPARKDGRPVSQYVIVVYHFHLH
ncbi:MAG TPA: energy transducer TonB [Pyrinomonadaceae bacterium]|nr:energy transducer TonB [Pyrinomonadaceae bacterium]